MENKDLLYEMRSIFRTIQRDYFKDDNKSKVLTPTQMEILDYIDKHQNEKIYQKDLEKALNTRRATISEVLKTMEKNNFIQRIQNEKDARSKEIIITDKAKKIFEEKNLNIKKLNKIITKDISKEDKIIFLKVLNKMKDNIEEEKQ